MICFEIQQISRSGMQRLHGIAGLPLPRIERTEMEVDGSRNLLLLEDRYGSRTSNNVSKVCEVDLRFRAQ